MNECNLIKTDQVTRAEVRGESHFYLPANINASNYARKCSDSLCMPSGKALSHVKDKLQVSYKTEQRDTWCYQVCRVILCHRGYQEKLDFV